MEDAAEDSPEESTVLAEGKEAKLPGVQPPAGPEQLNQILRWSIGGRECSKKETLKKKLKRTKKRFDLYKAEVLEIGAGPKEPGPRVQVCWEPPSRSLKVQGTNVTLERFPWL